jgi:hypothetical protein
MSKIQLGLDRGRLFASLVGWAAKVVADLSGVDSEASAQ